MLEVWLVYLDVHCLLYILAVIHWIAIQDFYVIDGDLVLGSPLQVKVLEHLIGGITRMPMSHCPSLEGPASLSHVCAAAILIIPPTPQSKTTHTY